jgi:hypothetical protein
MKRLDCNRKNLILIGIAAAIMLGGGRVRADFTISEATCVDQVINNGTNTQGCCLLHDGLKMYFSYVMPGGYGGRDIWVSTRQTQDAPWQEPVNLGPNINSEGGCYPSISPDEREIYFHPRWNSQVLMRSTRASKSDPWGPASEFTGLGYLACYPDISADGLSVYFTAERPGGYGAWDIWMAKRETTDAPWGEPVNLGPNVNDSRDQYCPSISADELALFYNNGGLRKVSVSTRSTKEDEWAPPVLLGPAVNGSRAHRPEISPDGSVLYFDAGSRSGGFNAENFWQVSIIPIVDLNDDGIVDSTDVCIMIDYWGTNEPSCDIGPMPWGDGVVDVQDLIVLAEHLFEEIPPVESVE